MRVLLERCVGKPHTGEADRVKIRVFKKQLGFKTTLHGAPASRAVIRRESSEQFENKTVPLKFASSGGWNVPSLGPASSGGWNVACPVFGRGY